MIRITLGLNELSKLISYGDNISAITNDGVTIVKLLNPAEPIVRTLADSVLFLYQERVAPQVIIRAFRTACQLAVDYINQLKYTVDGKPEKERDELLLKVAMTAMNSKLIAPCKEHFRKIIVGAVKALDDDLDLNMIGIQNHIKQVDGRMMKDSELVRGVAFKKTFSYAGFEQQPKKIEKPKVILLNVELELKNEKTNAQLHIKDPSEYQAFIDAEWNIIFTKLDQIVKTGANIVLSRLAIGDLTTQYFADRNIFCAGRVTQEDLERTSKALGVGIQSTTNDLEANQETIIGTCEVFEEKQIGNERYNYFRGCPKAKTATIVLRGGATKFLEEMERSVHDAIMVVRRAIKNTAILPGAGAIEMELSKLLRDESIKISGKQQLLIAAYARALEIIPRQLVDNAGFDTTNVVEKLRQVHYETKNVNMGVNIAEEGILNSFEACIWEPANMKINAISAATEAACLVLSVDETIKTPQSEQPGAAGGGRGRGIGRGMGR
ncbi:MAG: putative T-complex protein 1 subunit eta, partial [Streblomastix strix]